MNEREFYEYLIQKRDQYLQAAKAIDDALVYYTPPVKRGRSKKTKYTIPATFSECNSKVDKIVFALSRLKTCTAADIKNLLIENGESDYLPWVSATIGVLSSRGLINRITYPNIRSVYYTLNG